MPNFTSVKNNLSLLKGSIQLQKQFFLLGANCDLLYLNLLEHGKVSYINSINDFKHIAASCKNFQVDVFLLDFDQEEDILKEYVKYIKDMFPFAKNIFGVTRHEVSPLIKYASKIGLKDLYHKSEGAEKIIRRVNLLASLSTQNDISPPLHSTSLEAKISLRKRTFDIFFASIALLIVSPIMVIIALLIKFESKGPIFFISQRAGTGFKIFNFYKFRSMKSGADSQLQQLLQYNQYNQNAEITSFVKLRNDPRITKVGWFLRKTSLDELPQLFNVLKGDMSIVGNRPLPLYEAESLTRDEIVKRFFAPAGITGLWQVSKRGKKEMSEEERLALDVSYAQTRNGWYDLRIIWRTIPAMIQEETV